MPADIPPPLPASALPAPAHLPAGLPAAWLLHEDEHLLVLDKPAGLLAVPGRGADKQDCLSARVQSVYASAAIVHRLDMATSGLLLMARSADVQRQLSHAFAQRQVHKRYVAVLAGLLATAPGDGWAEVDAPISADWERRPLRVVDPLRGQPSLTRWRVLSHDPAAGTTRVELAPVTGRSHQLRLHMQTLGHPILGDPWYAEAATAARSPRLLLHACRLEFIHPVTGEAVVVESPAPF